MKSFFKDVFKRLAVTIVSAILFFVLSLVIFNAVISSIVDVKEKEPIDGAFLVLDLSMNLTDRPAGLKLEDLTREALTEEAIPPQFFLREVQGAIIKAASDTRIRGIFIEGSFIPSGYGCGYEAIKELIQSLRTFKKSGKEIVGYFSDPTQLDYLVYSLCDDLYMNPSGNLILNGLASEQMFFAEAMEKYGVGVQVIRVGDFKGAVEPFISTQFSDENRLQIERLLDLRWQDYLETICINRNIKKESLGPLLEKSFLLNPDDCLQAGLSDHIIPYGELLDKLFELVVEDEDTQEFARVELIDYVDRSNNQDLLRTDDKSGKAKIAIVYVEGAIVDGWGDDGIVVGGDEIADRIRKIYKDDTIKGIVLRVNSPGGSVSGSESILSELSRARERGLPVVISMGAVAASGGYWIAMDSDRIFAGQQTITGSIGVFGLVPNVKSLAKSFGLYWDVVKTQDSADVMSLSRPKSEGEIKIIQQHVNNIYDRFLSLVGQSRDLNISEVDKISQGRVWMGIDAYELGLIDEIGGLPDAVKYAADIARLSEYEVVDYPKVENPMDALSDLFDVSSSNLKVVGSSSHWNGLINNVESFLKQIRNFNDPINTYSFLPWYRGRFGFSQ